MSEIRAMDDNFDENTLAEDQTAADEVVPQGLTSNQADNQTPGQMLREARLARDCSEAELCGLTMLSKRTVQALEDDDFELLSQPVFVRGYYRKCAKVLAIDADRLLAAYAACPGTRAAPVPAPAGTAVKVVPADVTPGRRRPFGLVLLLLVLVVVAVVGYVYWSDSLSRLIGDEVGSSISLSTAFDSSADEPASDTTTSAADSAASAPILPDVLAADKKADAAAGRDQAAVDADADATAATENAATPAAADAGAESSSARAAVTLPDGATGLATAENNAVTAAPEASDENVIAADSDNAVSGDAATPQAPADTGSAGDSAAAAATVATALTVQFDDRSWVNIHDASGKQLLVGIYEDTTRTLDGEPPYRLVIGYAPGVSVRYDGHPVEFNMAGNHTARFTVGADNG